MYKAIMCDMDGTLAESRQPASKKMIELIEKLSKDHQFFIITGGKLSLINDQIISQLKSKQTHLHLLPTSGNQYYHYIEEKMDEVYKEDMATDDINLVLDAIMFTIHKFVLFPKAYDQIEIRDSQVTFSVLGRTAPQWAKMEYDPTGDRRKPFVEAMKIYLAKREPDFEIRIGGTTSIDITYKGHNKGYGLEKMKEIHGFKNKEILFIGDKCFFGGNDYDIAKEVPHIQVMDEIECERIFNKMVKGEDIEIFIQPPSAIDGIVKNYCNSI